MYRIAIQPERVALTRQISSTTGCASSATFPGPIRGPKRSPAGIPGGWSDPPAPTRGRMVVPHPVTIMSAIAVAQSVWKEGRMISSETTTASCPVPRAPCPVPRAPCPMPHALLHRVRCPYPTGCRFVEDQRPLDWNCWIKGVPHGAVLVECEINRHLGGFAIDTVTRYAVDDRDRGELRRHGLRALTANIDVERRQGGTPLGQDRHHIHRRAGCQSAQQHVDRSGSRLPGAIDTHRRLFRLSNVERFAFDPARDDVIDAFLALCLIFASDAHDDLDGSFSKLIRSPISHLPSPRGPISPPRLRVHVREDLSHAGFEGRP